MIALEPEAAALSCLEKTLDAFKSEKGTGSVYGLLARPNTHYMVVDIGGKFTTCYRIDIFYWTVKPVFWSANTVGYLHSFLALFVLYLVKLNNRSLLYASTNVCCRNL